MDGFKLENNNKGMSLVELIVVVLILGIVSVMGIMGVSNMHSMDAAQVTGTLESLVDKARITAITTDETKLAADGSEDADTSVHIWLRILYEDNQYYGVIIKKTGATEVELDKVEIGDKTIELSYNSTKITDSKDIRFNKSDGSFNGTNEGDKFVVKTLKTTKNVYLVKNTGRCYVQ